MKSGRRIAAGVAALGWVLPPTIVGLQRRLREYFIDWHSAPRRPCVITLSCESEVDALIAQGGLDHDVPLIRRDRDVRPFCRLSTLHMLE